MKANTVFLALLAFFGLSCSGEKGAAEEGAAGQPVTNQSGKSDEAAEEDGPPFSDSCACAFDYIGKIRSSNTEYDVIVSGKGWNPEYKSCNCIWGELINNEAPQDSSVTDFKIHLVDLDTSIRGNDRAFLTSKAFNDNLIITCWNDSCTFDPNKTGKYRKPKYMSK